MFCLPDEAEALISELAALFTDMGDASGRGVYGVRGLLEAAPVVRELAASPALRRSGRAYSGAGLYRRVRGILCSTRSRARTGKCRGIRI